MAHRRKNSRAAPAVVPPPYMRGELSRYRRLDMIDVEGLAVMCPSGCGARLFDFRCELRCSRCGYRDGVGT